MCAVELSALPTQAQTQSQTYHWAPAFGGTTTIIQPGPCPNGRCPKLAPTTRTYVTETTTAVTQPDGTVLNETEVSLIEKTNQHRLANGLRALVVDPVLMIQARRHCTRMLQRGQMVHSGEPVAENVAAGQANASGVIQSWKNSSGHNANMLGAGYTRIGVTGYQAPDGTTYWIQQFR